MRTGNDTAPRAFASLRFTGVDLDPSSLTALLGCDPTTSYARGERYVAGRQKKEHIRRFGLWLFDTDAVLNDPDLQHHVDLVEKILTNDASTFWNDVRYDKINIFVRDNKLDMDVSLFWRGFSSLQPVISSEFEEVIRSMGGQIERDMLGRRDDQERQTQVFA